MENISGQLLLQQIAIKIHSRELRMSINAKTILPLESVSLLPPDFGLGVIPKLAVITDVNEKAMKAINDCSHSIYKLNLIGDFIGFIPNSAIKDLLKDDLFDKLSLHYLEDMLVALSIGDPTFNYHQFVPEKIQV